MSLISVKHPLTIAQVGVFSVSRIRYPLLNRRRTGDVDDGPLPQYHALAVGTILFYDYLLTLGDEVRRDFALSALWFLTETSFF